MRRTVPLAVLAVAACFTLGGCGGSDSASSGSDGGDAPSTTAASAPAVVATSTDAGSSDESSSGSLDVCTDLTADEVGQALGETVTEKSLDVGCSFESSDGKAPYIAFQQKSTSDYAGGFDSAKSGLQYVVTDGTAKDLPGIGDAATIDVGTTPGSRGPGGVGFVQVGDAIVQVDFYQDSGLSASDVTPLLTAVMTLVGSKY